LSAWGLLWGVICLKDGPSFISTPVLYVYERVHPSPPSTPIRVWRTRLLLCARLLVKHHHAEGDRIKVRKRLPPTRTARGFAGFRHAPLLPPPPDLARAAAGVAVEFARVVEGEHPAAQFDGLAAGEALRLAH